MPADVLAEINPDSTFNNWDIWSLTFAWSSSMLNPEQIVLVKGLNISFLALIPPYFVSVPEKLTNGVNVKF